MSALEATVTYDDACDDGAGDAFGCLRLVSDNFVFDRVGSGVRLLDVFEGRASKSSKVNEMCDFSDDDFCGGTGDITSLHLAATSGLAGNR